jgi:hypothetical protein
MIWFVNVIFLAGLLVSLWVIATRRARSETRDRVPVSDRSSNHLSGAAPAGA